MAGGFLHSYLEVVRAFEGRSIKEASQFWDASFIDEKELINSPYADITPEE